MNLLKVTFNEDKTKFAIVGDTVDMAMYLENSDWNSEYIDETNVVQVISPYEMVKQLLNDAVKPELIENETSTQSLLHELFGQIFQEGWLAAERRSDSYPGTEFIVED